MVSADTRPDTSKWVSTATSGGENATLTLPDGRSFSLRILKPTMGSDLVCDARTLYSDGRVLLFDPGFNSVASCPSAITYVDGDAGKCLYRGYSVADLCDKFQYLDVCFLLLYGDLPDPKARIAFTQQIKSEMMVHTRIRAFIETFVPGAHPMSILCSTMAAMASFYDGPMSVAHVEDWEARELACIRLVSKLPTIVAMIYKNFIGEPVVYPRADLNFCENFLHMMFSTPVEPYVVDPLHVQIIDSFLTIHADHEQNASTSTVRSAGSSLANPYACVASGVSSLWGRAHGGANEAVIEMLKAIGSPKNIPAFLERVKRREVRLMGFGHRVYRNYDPRAKVMQGLCRQLLERHKNVDPLFVTAQELEKIAMQDEYFVSRKLFPNVDFYSGIVMRALGIPHDMFTVMFAMGRIVGWLAHWKEMVAEGVIKIVRPRQLYCGVEERRVPDKLNEEPVEAPISLDLGVAVEDPLDIRYSPKSGPNVLPLKVNRDEPSEYEEELLVANHRCVDRVQWREREKI